MDEETALILHPQAKALRELSDKITTELRSEITELQLKYSLLKQSYDSVLDITQKAIDEMSEQISAIRSKERELLQGYSPQHQDKLLEWIIQDEEEPSIISINKVDDNLCKALYKNIANVTHPDKDLEGKYLDYFQQAAKAYKARDLLSLKMIKQDLVNDTDLFTKILDSSDDQLQKERDALDLLVEDLTRNIQQMKIFGLKIKDYIDNNHQLNIDELETALYTLITKTFDDYSLKKEETVTEPVVPSSETSLQIKEKETALILSYTSKEKLHVLKQRITNLLSQVDKITPFYAGFKGHGVYLTLSEDEGKFSPYLSIFTDVIKEMHREEMGLPADDIESSRIIEIGSFGTGMVYFSLFPDGKIILPQNSADNFTSSMQVLGNLEKMLNQPSKVLSVAGFQSRPTPILGNYSELTGKSINNQYRLNDNNEVFTNRLLRALIYLKIPRITEYRDFMSKSLWVAELQESFRYYGDRNPGEMVTQEVMVEYATDDIRSEVHTGEIFEMEDREIANAKWDRLHGCQKVTYGGYLHLDQKVKTTIKYSGISGIGSSLSSLKIGGRFDLQVNVNDKIATARYDSLPGTTNNLLIISGIDENIWPDLIHTIITRFVVTGVTAQNLYSNIKMKYL